MKPEEAVSAEEANHPYTMNFIRRLFTKTTEVKGPFFQIQSSALRSPEHWGQDVVHSVRLLTEAERNNLQVVAELFQQVIGLHCKFFLGTGYSLSKVQQDSMHLIRSYFELTCFYWMIFARHLLERDVRVEVGHAFGHVLGCSFWGFESAFMSSTFKDYESAFDDRTRVYERLVGLYFQPRESELEVYHELFDFIVDRPLSDESSESERVMTFVKGFADPDKQAPRLVFTRELARGVRVFSEQLRKLHF